MSRQTGRNRPIRCCERLCSVRESARRAPHRAFQREKKKQCPIGDGWRVNESKSIWFI